MTEQFRFSNAERKAVEDVLAPYVESAKLALRITSGIVEDIEAAVNRAREDPIGTIRRNTLGARVGYAIKTDAGWLTVYANGDRNMAADGFPNTIQATLWPIFHRPETE